MNTTKSILYAEDSPQDAEMTLTALESYRIVNKVVHVEDGEQVLDYLNRQGRFKDRAPGNPVLIMLDLKMPKLDGIETLRAIKSNAAWKTTPVVILTSSREESDVVKSYQLGANAYVVKPVGFQQFTEAVRQLGAFWTIHNEPPPPTSASAT